ncbi:hypothetical protein OB919_10690 [Halobacteria archaeon AArc-curdl1]|uniref:Uncharacterized protein n=1 Tax=Natronosalvus hydrolyticus TaxID=2979988 RepID=A0AAP2Z8V5_9EURY|nr:hypothetical protein [Halobacteria archaeon AArc-curdl1]
MNALEDESVAQPLEGTVSPAEESSTVPAASSLEWTVEPETAQTVRWLLVAQVALVDVALVFGGLLGVGWLLRTAPLFGGVVGVFVAVLTLRYGFAIAPIERWRPGGAMWGLERGFILRGFALGAVLYLLGTLLFGTWLVVVAVGAAVLFGLANVVTGDGAARGRLDLETEAVAFAGRRADISALSSVRTVTVGDLRIVRLEGPSFGELRWFAVPAGETGRSVVRTLQHNTLEGDPSSVDVEGHG